MLAVQLYQRSFPGSSETVGQMYSAKKQNKLNKSIMFLVNVQALELELDF